MTYTHSTTYFHYFYSFYKLMWSYLINAPYLKWRESPWCLLSINRSPVIVHYRAVSTTFPPALCFRSISTDLPCSHAVGLYWFLLLTHFYEIQLLQPIWDKRLTRSSFYLQFYMKKSTSTLTDFLPGETRHHFSSNFLSSSGLFMRLIHICWMV